MALRYPLPSHLQRTQYNRTWIPENLSELDFGGNCTRPSLFSAHFYRTTFPNGGNYPAQTTVTVLFQGYERYWDSRKIRKPTESQAISWFYEDLVAYGTPRSQNLTKNTVSVGQYLLRHSMSRCHDEICALLPWQGNSDQAGRGMLLTYNAEAVMVTTYVAIILFARASRTRKRPKDSENSEFTEDEAEPSHSFFQRIHRATLNTLRVFLDGALLFCIAMIIAAIVGSAVTLRESRDALTALAREREYREQLKSAKAPTMSSPLFSTLAALFSIFPAMALHSIAPKVLRRKIYRNYVWILIACLTTAMIILTEIAVTEAEKLKGEVKAVLRDPEGQYTFERQCVRGTEFEDLRLAIRILFSIRGGLTLVYLIFLALWSYSPLRKNKIFATMRKVWSVTAPVTSILGVWCTLAIFWYFRNKIGNRSGETNKNHEWSFGQIIAISTFAPVLVELAFSWKLGPRKANETAMNKGLGCVYKKSPEKTEDKNETSEPSGVTA